MVTPLWRRGVRCQMPDSACKRRAIDADLYAKIGTDEAHYVLRERRISAAPSSRASAERDRVLISAES